MTWIPLALVAIVGFGALYALGRRQLRQLDEPPRKRVQMALGTRARLLAERALTWRPSDSALDAALAVAIWSIGSVLVVGCLLLLLRHVSADLAATDRPAVVHDDSPLPLPEHIRSLAEDVHHVYHDDHHDSGSSALQWYWMHRMLSDDHRTVVVQQPHYTPAAQPTHQHWTPAPPARPSYSAPRPSTPVYRAPAASRPSFGAGSRISSRPTFRSGRR